MITITISGPPRSGKTAVAHAIRRELERLMSIVTVDDNEGNDDKFAEQHAQKVVASKHPHITIKVVNTNKVVA